MEKLTYVVALDSAIACTALTEEVRNKLNALREQLTKKSEGEKKPTKNQTANADLQTAIYDQMEKGKAYTVTEMLKALPALDGLTNQKASAMLRQMKLANLVSREEIKGKSYFTKVSA